MNDQNTDSTPENPAPTPRDQAGNIKKVVRTRGPGGGHSSGAPRIGFGQAIALGFQNYFTFQGRATRSEYWYFFLFCLIANFAAGLVIGFLGALIGLSLEAIQMLAILPGLVLFFPNLSVSIRRLHDVNRSGWWWWLLLVPCIGGIVLLVWDCTEGTRGENDYGPPRRETI
jgi:uncharacterized membrane protein YhaH (DUF805 family)